MTLKHQTLSLSRHTLSSLFACAIALCIGACAGAEEAAVKATPTEQRFREAMEKFNDEDYEAARKLFEAIVLQDPASEQADDAQYYLAESYFLEKDYHLAAYAYNRVSSFPNSPYYKIAIYKTGESYYYGSASYDRDQKETRAAIDHFRSFAQRYAGDSLATLAQRRIVELRTKLARRDYESALQYMRLDDPTAALVYFTKVINDYPDTEYFGLSVGGKLDALCALERGVDARAFADSIMLAKPNELGIAGARTFQTMGCK